MLDNMGCCGCAGVLGCVALRNLARMVPNPEASESAPPDAGCGPLICADVAGAGLNRDERAERGSIAMAYRLPPRIEPASAAPVLLGVLCVPDPAETVVEFFGREPRMAESVAS